jgi:molecular chaperone Hsp33
MDATALDAAWRKAEGSMSSITPATLLEDDVEQRLVGMFGIDEVRVFSGHDVKFECRCSRERVASVLRSLGVEEVRSVIAEQGTCTVTCEFCQKPYKFDAIDVEQLFDDAAPKGSDAIN